MQSDGRGLTLTDVLEQAWMWGFDVQSNFFRTNAQLVAMAATLGLITTMTPKGFGKTWRITLKGLDTWLSETSLQM